MLRETYIFKSDQSIFGQLQVLSIYNSCYYRSYLAYTADAFEIELTNQDLVGGKTLPVAEFKVS